MKEARQLALGAAVTAGERKCPADVWSSGSRCLTLVPPRMDTKMKILFFESDSLIWVSPTDWLEMSQFV